MRLGTRAKCFNSYKATNQGFKKTQHCFLSGRNSLDFCRPVCLVCVNAWCVECGCQRMWPLPYQGSRWKHSEHFFFIGFEPTKYGLRVLHRISACRYQTTLELIVKFTRRLGTCGTCWWWTLLINSSQRCAPGSSRASSRPKCKGSLRFQQSHGSNRVHLHFPWAALSNRGLSPYTGLLGGAQIPYASNSRALLKGDLKGILTLYKQTFRYCMFILQIQEVGWCWTWPWGTTPWLFLISAIIRCGFIFYQN